VVGSRNYFGAICSILAGLLYIGMVTLFIVVPVGANAVVDHHHYANILNVGHFLLAFLGLAGLAAVPALTERVSINPSSFLSFTRTVAMIGFALMSVNNFRQTGLDHPLAHEAMMKGGDVLDTVVIGWAGFVELSPDGWLDFGGVGLWIIALSFTALRMGTVYRKVSVLGLVAGVCLLLTVLGNAIGFQPLVVMGIGIGGLTVIPAWFVTNGILQLKQKQPGATISSLKLAGNG
jgi:hypothetical protein